MEVSNLKICEPHVCTGCAACLNICPHNAIEMQFDRKGFYVPCIDAGSCTECGLCAKTCPSNYDVQLDGGIKQKVYAAKSRNRSILMMSSSGGLFTVLANEILGGAVELLPASTLRILKMFSIRFALRKKNLEPFVVQSTSRHPPIGFIQS